MFALPPRVRFVAPGLGPVLATYLLAVSAGAMPFQTPDVIVYDVGVNGTDTNDIHYYGQTSGIAAYSIATQSCNSGTAQLLWDSDTTEHPVIAQNMFRLKGGRFEQIGQSWLKHGFCAVNEIESFCAPCQQTPCETLGIGCADTYWATLNDGRNGQSKRLVNATSGTHVHGGGPTGDGLIRGRLQVAVADVAPAQNPGAQWFIEGQYVTADDAQAGVGGDNASWRRVNVVSVSNIDGGGPTMRQEPAIFAWPFHEAGVEVKTVPIVENDGKSLMYLGFKVTDLGYGRWIYEYALQNLNSDQSAGSISIPVHAAAMVWDIGFHDVAYHSGDPYDGTDWPGLRNGGEIRWATDPHSVNVNANALRWGTLYNFRFIASVPPVRGPVTIGLFKPGPSTAKNVNDVWVPGGEPSGPHALPNPRVPRAPITTGRPRGSTSGAPVLVELSPALIGGTWQGGIEGGAAESLVYVSFAGSSHGTRNPMGELLIRPAGHLLPNGVLAIPNDPELEGMSFAAQAAVRTSAGWRLSSALDVQVRRAP